MIPDKQPRASYTWDLLLLDVLCTLEWHLFAVEPDGYLGATLGGSLSAP